MATRKSSRRVGSVDCRTSSREFRSAEKAVQTNVPYARPNRTRRNQRQQSGCCGYRQIDDNGTFRWRWWNIGHDMLASRVGLARCKLTCKRWATAFGGATHQHRRNSCGFGHSGRHQGASTDRNTFAENDATRLLSQGSSQPCRAVTTASDSAVPAPFAEGCCPACACPA